MSNTMTNSDKVTDQSLVIDHAFDQFSLAQTIVQDETRTLLEKTLLNSESRASISPSLQKSLSMSKVRPLQEGDRFQFEKQIGEGGFGQVWQVRDHNLKRAVAIKSYKATREIAHQVCLDEVKFSGRLDHPSIPTIYDAGMTDEGDPYVIMKLLEGEHLGAVIARLQGGDQATLKKWTFAKRVGIIIQVLRALSGAHREGILHRDVKPENILIHPDGNVWLIDWGCAVELSEVKEQSHLCGTPLYMPPEQVLGGALSPASDLFALAGVAYELLSLKSAAPQASSLQEMLSAILTHEPLQMGYVNHPVQGYAPVDFQMPIMRALSRNMADRPQNADAMINDFELALAGEIEVVCQVTSTFSRFYHLLNWLKANPPLRLTILYLVVFGCALAFLSLGYLLGKVI